MDYPRPILTVDVALFTLVKGRLHVALMRRQGELTREPGKLALPGGFVRTDQDASAEDAALRVLTDKLGFRPPHIEQAFTESGPNRDPQGWSASIVYLALNSPENLMPLVLENKVELYDVHDGVGALPKLAFDHNILIQKAITRLKMKASYTPLVAHFMGEEFTLSELQGAYEAVLGTKLTKANFRRKFDALNAVVPVAVKPSAGRPAVTFKLNPLVTYFDRTI